MYTLSTEKKLAVISALVEGNSIRSINRITDVDRNTINSLLLRSGNHCMSLLERHLRELKCRYVQCDEIWTYVQKKNRRVREGDPPEVGDQWVFVAMDSETKLVPSFIVGKRTLETTLIFLRDLRWRLADTRFQITTDGFHFYELGVEDVFGGQVDFAQLIKLFGDFGQRDTEARYSPPRITEVISRIRNGRPDPEHISTSYVERQNLTMRMAMRRFTRLTNAFSKKLANLKAACALHFAHYNFCRIHQSLRVTPAMAAGVSSDVWLLERLLA
jgi:IS1 family transposase